MAGLFNGDKMQIVKRKLKVTIYEKEYELVIPSAMRSAEFSDEIESSKGLTNVQILGKTQDYIKEMGLPKDICEDLDIDNLKSLIEFVSDKKK